MADLRTDYVNDVLDTDVNNERTYNLVDANGNLIYEGIKIRETTVLATTGDDYGALQINEQNEKINQINADLSDISADITDISTTLSNKQNTLLIVSQVLKYRNSDSVIGHVVKYGRMCFLHVRFTATDLLTDNVENFFCWIPKAFAPYAYDWIIAYNGSYENTKHNGFQIDIEQYGTANQWDQLNLIPLKANIEIGDSINFDVAYISNQ